MRTGKLKVIGVSCVGWAREVQHAMKSVNGVNDVKVVLGSGDAEVQFDERVTSFDDVKLALLKQGFAFSTPDSYAA